MADILAIPSDACGCSACTPVTVTVANQVVISGGQLLQGDGPPHGVVGIDPPPYPTTPTQYWDRLSGIAYYWNIVTQDWD